MIRVLTILITILSVSINLGANSIVVNARPAVSLNNVTLYPDSTFIMHSNIILPEGEIFEVLGETAFEHEDAAQNQKFKWYFVRSRHGQEGWIFGDGLAVLVPEENVDVKIRPYYMQRMQFNNGFEDAIMWVASIEGRDNFHEQDYLNPPYRESYFVITNDEGSSVYFNFSGANATGKTDVRSFQLHDTTGDGIPDFVLQTSSVATNETFENRNMEIYSFQSGSLDKVFDERMTLSYGDDLVSPALYKYVEIDKNLIRVAYVDYLPCKAYRLPFPYDELKKENERCLEYVTYTYQWNEQLKKYQILYAESRTSPQAHPHDNKVDVKKDPSYLGKVICVVNKTDKLQVIKHFERYVLENGKKKIVPYLYVKLPSGNFGYIMADEIDFINIEHANLLHKYYQLKPLTKGEWSSDEQFLKIVADASGSVFQSLMISKK
jgi:hypothetical protein